jgi:hypothetical protein
MRSKFRKLRGMPDLLSLAVAFLVTLGFIVALAADVVRSHYGWWTGLEGFNVALWGVITVNTCRDLKRDRA